ncbi:hypothetical protein [Micromonospora sp. AKA38]|uniref:hypothetical protein n=1 Tax=Micromonospora sp. AKA38 TaxID=2733861 RepID=UPI0024923324|nr:hypothetical protein [Micromonospora sp. AKA38]
MTPRAGELLEISRAASVQFVRPIMFRVIRRLDWTTYDGWAWLEGYELDAAGDAVARRTVFVQPAGLRRLSPAHPPAHPPTRRRTGTA